MKKASDLKIGLLGKSLGHSFSKRYFSEKFQRQGIPLKYENFELSSLEELNEKIRSNESIVGFNVTFPYKKTVLQHLDFQHDTVRATGACNTVVCFSGYLLGYNTDVDGFRCLLHSSRGLSNKSNVLILGTGGAAASVAWVLDGLGHSYDMVSRRSEDGLRYEDIQPQLLSNYDVIVQATPLGTAGELETLCPPLPYQAIQANQLCIDLNYNPATTVFLKHCQNQGANVVNGLVMLQAQAEAAWQIWKHWLEAIE